MKTIEIAYDYVFYTIYRFWEKVPSRWWSDWKAVITICFLLFFAMSSILNTSIYACKIDLVPETKFLTIIIGLIIYGLNYYYFLYKDKWRGRILKFKSLNKRVDRIGVCFVIFSSIIIIISLIYSCHLLSIVDWQNLKRF